MKKTLLALGALSLVAGSVCAQAAIARPVMLGADQASRGPAGQATPAPMPGQGGGGVFHAHPVAEGVATPAPMNPYFRTNPKAEKAHAHKQIARNLPYLTAHLAMMESSLTSLEAVAQDVKESVRKKMMKHVMHMKAELAKTQARLSHTKAAHHDAVTNDSDLAVPHHRHMFGSDPHTWGPPQPGVATPAPMQAIATPAPMPAQ